MFDDYSSRSILSHKILYLLIAINIVIYSIIILIYPGFISDDFLVFSLITKSGSCPISLNPDDLFFLFFRPVSYFFFWLDYNLWGTQFIFMKITTLVLHIGLVIVIYKIIEHLSLLFGEEINRRILFFSLLIFSIHPDVLTWIYWISNRTELLSLLFYACSILVFLIYINNNKSYLLLFLTIFYLLSVLSKQQGIHLPILLIFILFSFRQKIRINFSKKLIITFFTLFVILFAVSLLQYLYFSNDLQVFELLWKKPFSLAGNLLHTIVPPFSNDIYNYFILNKTVALLIGSAILVIILIYFQKNGKIKPFLIFLFFYLIISYPRIFAVGSQRLNGILLLWLVVGIYFIVTNLDSRAKNLIILLLAGFYSFSFIHRVEVDRVVLTKPQKELTELKQIDTSNSHNKKIIIIANNSYILPYSMQFEKDKVFGMDSSLVVLPFYYDRSLIYYNLDKYNKQMLEVTINYNEITISTFDSLFYMDINKNSDTWKLINGFKGFKSYSGRGYGRMKFNYSRLDSAIYLYNDGLKWFELN